jgi:hypothetical protein
MQTKWNRATLGDVADLLELSKQYFEHDAHDVFPSDARVLEQNLAHAVLQQHYNPWSNCVLIARDQAHKILAYTWIVRGERVCYSSEEIAMVRMAHVDMSLSTRNKIQLLTDMLQFWQTWAQECGIAMICSSTVRNDQTAFLRLHQRHGYSVRGSICYKRIGN